MEAIIKTLFPLLSIRGEFDVFDGFVEVEMMEYDPAL